MARTESDSPRSAREIFSEAIEKPTPDERCAYLDLACGPDPLLRKQVEELLANHFEQDAFMEGPAISAETIKLNLPITEGPGSRIGRYKLLQMLGEGGMGVVYMAEQEEPVRRRVALKIIKLGMDTRQVVARFEAERQALALMDHPNIARVLDGGATETGRPYFVMEVVQGLPITEFCDKNHLPSAERVKLFIPVCHAIQSAHQKGIIHRDVKPSNILVTLNGGVAVPKVIDFGVAKATNQKLTEKTLFTNYGMMVGTPAYMSPEQAELTSLDVDTRTDIYSLGVVLYELLTGTTPFPEKELRSVGYREMQRIILEEQPERPSTRLSTMLAEQRSAVARNQGTHEATLVKSFASDLDWIVMKCLEKDRARRYETVNGLDRDIQRHLDNEPVLARPPSRLYEFQKTVRRHKLGFAAAAAVMVTLGGGVLVSSWEAIRAQRFGKQALQARSSEAELRQFFQRNVVRQYVANGTRLMNEGDLFGSLLWYTEALRVDAGDPQREEPHRIRIASVLDQCPKLLNVFSPGTMLYHAEFSPDGSKVLTSSDDHTAKVWDATSGRMLLTLHHDDDVYDATSSPDGRWIVSSSKDKTARIWDAETGRLLRTLPHHDTVWRACFSPDLHLIATASQDKSVQLWNAQTGEPVGGPLVHRSHVERVNFSPDGRFLSTKSWNEGGYVWDVTTGQKLFESTDTGFFGELPFSPDSKEFLTGDSSSVRVWDTEKFTELPFSPLKLHGPICTVSFSADGRTILAAGRGYQAWAWDAATGQPLFAQPVSLAGEILDARISPDGRYFVTGSQDRSAQLWSTRTGQPFGPPLKHILHVKYVRFNPDGRRLLVNSCDQAARVWDQAARETECLSAQVPNERHVVSSDGQYQLQRPPRESNVVWIVQARSGEKVAALRHTNQVGYYSFSRDNRTVITACEEKNMVSSTKSDIFLWEAPTGRQINTNSMSHLFRLLYAAFSPDNSRLLTCSFDYSARLWDARTGQPLSPPLRHDQQISWGAFSPDGRSIVTVSRDKTARVWDATNGDPLTSPLLHNAIVVGAFWSDNGKRLVTVTTDHHIQAWDLSSGEPLTPPRKFQTLEGSESHATMLAPAGLSERLRRDDRPVADLVLLAQMMAVGRVDSGGNVVPLQLQELTSAWQFLREKYPNQFEAAPSEIVAWHRRSATESKAEGNWAAALFHIDRALEKLPQDPILIRERAECASKLAEQTNHVDRDSKAQRTTESAKR
jgi:WD40 repeat protein/serine/threonine protein kinase